MHKSVFARIAIWLPIIAAIVILAVSLFSVPLSRDLISYAGYYFTLALFLLWVWCLFRCFVASKPDVIGFIKANWIGIVMSVLLAVIIFASVEHLFRVLSDETNLLSVSKSMTYDRRADNVTMGTWYYDNFYPINREIEKRPLIFPFFTYLVHLVLGYRPENVFILNFIVLLVLFFLLYRIGKGFWGEVGGVAGIILVAAQPIISQIATSAGFNLFFVLFLVMSFLALRAFLRERTPLRFELLWLTLLVVASSRYEGVVSFVIVMAFLGIFGYLKKDLFGSGFGVSFAMTPLLFLPYIWARIVVDITRTLETTDTAFSVGSCLKHTLEFFKSFVDYRLFLPYAALVGLIGFIGLIYLIWKYRSCQRSEGLHLTIISFICLMADFIIYTSLYNGNPAHPSSCRYFALFYMILSLSATALAIRIARAVKRPAVPIVFAIAMFMIYHPVAIEDRFSRAQTEPREYRFIMEFLRAEAAQNRRFVVIVDRPGQYTAHNYGAVDFNYMVGLGQNIMDGLKNHLYRDVFAVQKINYLTQQPQENMDLTRLGYSLETMAELQGTTDYFLRISRIRPK